MGDVLRVVAGAAMVVGGIVTGNPGLIIAGASTVGAVLLSPGEMDDRQKGFQGEAAGTESPLVVVYGRAQIGVNVYETRVDTDSPENRFLAKGGAICLGSQATQAGKGIEGVEVVRISGRDAILPVSGDTIAFSSSPTTDGVQDPWDQQAPPPLNPGDALEYSLFSGLHDQTVPSDLNTRFPSLWDSDHRGRGVAHILIGARFQREIYSTGIPRLQMVVRGQHVFDPRDNSWKYSTNPWLCALDYLLSRGYGKGVYRGVSDPLYWALHNLSAATGSQALFDDKALSDIGLSVGQDVSCAVELRSDSGVDQIRHRLVWKDASLATIRTDDSTITTSSSFDRVELEGITVPANAEFVTWEVVNLDGADTWAFQRAEMLKRPSMLSFLDRVDLQSFIDEANYADEEVTVNVDGSPTTKTRFEVGGFLSTADDVDQNLQLIAAAGRGGVVFEGGRFRATSRKGTATPSGYKLTPDKLVGEWKVRRLGVEEAPNTVQVTYTDQDREFQAHDVVWPEEDDFAFLDADKGFEADVEMGIPFVPDETTAKQIGMVSLREMRQDVTIEATVDHEAMQLQVHDLVEVTLPTEGWTDKQFWVVALQIRPDYTIDLVLREFDSSAYNLSDQTAEATVPGTDLPDPFTTDPISGLTLTSDASTAVDTQDGFRVPAIQVQWTEPADTFVDYYVIRYKKDADSDFIRWPDSDRGDDSTTIYPVTEGELYDVEIVAVNTMGIRSTVVSDQITPASLPSEPLSGGLLGRNLDFEAGDLGWGKSNEASIVEDAANALRGSWVGRIQDTGGSGGELINQETFSVAPGERFLAEAWIKSSAGADGECAVRIEWQDESGTALGEAVGSTISGGTTSYTRSKLVTTAPANAVQARVEAQSTGQTTGTFYIDDVVIGRILSDEDMSPNTIALTINADAAGASNPGEFALSAVENGDADYTRDGRVIWDGVEISVPRDAGDGFTGLVGGADDGQKGFILFDTDKPGTPRFTANSQGRHVVFAYKKNDGNWYYDTNTGETTFTPQSSDVALGWLEKGTGDNIARGGLFGAPVDLELAAFPTADPTADNPQNLDWLEADGLLLAGNMALDGTNEQIRFGSASAPLSGIGIFLGLDGTDYEFRAGDPGGDYIHWDGATLEVVGDITATTISADSGTIGGWTLNTTDIFSGNVALESDTERILIGSATAPLTGAGVFLGLAGGAYDLRAGDPAGDYIHWDGSAGTLTIHGGVIESPASGTDPSLLGWSHDMSFSASDQNTVAWTSGTIELANGTTYSITGSNTGNMTAATYIYLDTAVSTTALQTTTTGNVAVGANRILVAVAGPSGESGKDAEFIVYGGGANAGVSKLFTAVNIAAQTITGNEVDTNTLNANHISSLSFSGKTATFDTGSVGGWTMSSNELTSGNVTIDADAQQILLGPATAPLTGTGIFMGLSGGVYEFRAGDPAGDYIHWDGATFEINADSFTGSNPVFGGVVTIEAGQNDPRIELTAASGHAKMVMRDNAGGTSGGLEVGRWFSDAFSLFSNREMVFAPTSVGDGIFAGTIDGGVARVFSLHRDLSDRTVSAVTSEVILETISIPANSIGAQGGVRVVVKGSVTGTNNLKTVRVKYGGTLFGVDTYTSGDTGNFIMVAYLFANGSTSSQRGWSHGGMNGDPLAVSNKFSLSIDSTVAQDLVVTGDLADTGDEIVVEATFAEFVSAPV